MSCLQWLFHVSPLKLIIRTIWKSMKDLVWIRVRAIEMKWNHNGITWARDEKDIKKPTTLDPRWFDPSTFPCSHPVEPKIKSNRLTKKKGPIIIVARLREDESGTFSALTRWSCVKLSLVLSQGDVTLILNKLIIFFDFWFSKHETAQCEDQVHFFFKDEWIGKV